MPLIRACACGERTNTHQACRASASSSVNRPRPVSSRSSSTRGSGWPIYITSFCIALEAAAAAQALELPHDFASVAAAARGHQLDEEFRTVRERCLDRFEAPAVVARRLGRQALDTLALADGQREVEARLRARLRSAQRRIERHGAKAA